MVRHLACVRVAEQHGLDKAAQLVISCEIDPPPVLPQALEIDL